MRFYKIMLTLFTKGQAATPAWKAGRWAPANSPAAASSADAATTEGGYSAIFTSAKRKTEEQFLAASQLRNLTANPLAFRWHWRAGAARTLRTRLGADEEVDGARLDVVEQGRMPGRREARREVEAEEGEGRDGARAPLQRAQHQPLHAPDVHGVEHELLVPLHTHHTTPPRNLISN